LSHKRTCKQASSQPVTPLRKFALPFNPLTIPKSTQHPRSTPFKSSKLTKTSHQRAPKRKQSFSARPPRLRCDLLRARRPPLLAQPRFCQKSHPRPALLQSPAKSRHGFRYPPPGVKPRERLGFRGRDNNISESEKRSALAHFPSRENQSD
jgi:hypothetical protein